MAFFGNDAVNRVNLHTTVQAIAQAGGGVFFVVFLIKAGLSVPQALLAIAAIQLGRFILRPAILPLAKRWGLKPLLIVGTVGMALQYQALAQVHGVGWGLLALCVTAAVADVLYWPTYHAFFAAIGDAEHRGHQVSIRDAMVSVIGIVAPLLGAWGLVALGPGPMFGAVGVVQALSALPLLGAPNVPVKAQVSGVLGTARLAVTLCAVDGWFDIWFLFVWQIALFQSLGQSLSAFGGAMALAALVGAVAGLLLGRHVDAGHGRRAVMIVAAVATIVVGLKAASVGVPWAAVAANALGPIFYSLRGPVSGTPIYNLSQASACPIRFTIATEAGWDVGSAAACLASAGLAWAGVSLSLSILLALPALGLSAWLLRRYYARAGLALPA